MLLKENRPRFSIDDAVRLVRTRWGVRVAGARELPSERDQNFRLDDGTKPAWILKIASASDSRDVLDLQNEALSHAIRRAPDLPLPGLRPTAEGEPIVEAEDAGGRSFLVRLYDYLPGRPMAEVRPQGADLLRSLGRLLGRLDVALSGFSHEQQNRSIVWDSRRAREVVEGALPLIEKEERRACLERCLALYAKEALPRLTSLPRGVIHNDGNDHNVLVGEDGLVSGLLDFGDMLESPLVVEPANAAAYAMLAEAGREPLRAAAHVVAGYNESRTLDDEELESLFPFITARLAMSVSISARQYRDEPEKKYLQVSEAPAWDVLLQLSAECPRLARDRFRLACGKPPHPGGAAVVDWIQDHAEEAACVLPFDPRKEPFHVLDLSAGSRELSGLDVLDDVERFTRRVLERIETAGARVGVGRYDEARPVYTSDAFQPSGIGEPRTVHLGIDLFVPPGTPVHAPFPGRVHGLRNNRAPLDYGPTVILEHETDSGERFWTLYGHLAEDCLTELEEGRAVGHGEAFAAVGGYPANGNWPPHLHFQIVLDPLDRHGDFPGVAAPSDRALWKALSPDPSHLLHLPPEAVAEAASRGSILERRRRHLSTALSVSYEQPLHIVRGYGAFLYDAEARPYLDMVNNVCHVGHAHPKVTRAASQQMAVLNTNTRYLHENLVAYAERLSAKLPEPLGVCFFVNSGSEANDLALRLARAHTGREDVLVLDGAYHGNLSSLIDVSPYKFDGPGGRGAPVHVAKLPMPDGFRGRFRARERDYAERYVEAALETLRAMEARGRPAGAFLAESIMSCGGQIVLPPGYLRSVFDAVRAAGGVTIADEVQVGFGRVGSHFWGFESEGVVPDIVTMGKPIGNGHPLGAVVTTREIAASFDDGMEYFNTFGGNPVSCAAGLAVLDVIEEEGLQANARSMGEILLAALEELKERHGIIGDVRGRGLFLGFELVRDRETLEPAAEEAAYLVNRMREELVLTSTDGPLHNVIKLKPPLVFSRAHADRFLLALVRVLGEDRLKT